MIKEGGAEAVKIEGGVNIAHVIKAVSSIDIPVMAHIGLTPQSIHRMGGYKVQGRKEQADRIIEDALAVQEAGAFSVVLEGIPAKLAEQITSRCPYRPSASAPVSTVMARCWSYTISSVCVKNTPPSLSSVMPILRQSYWMRWKTTSMKSETVSSLRTPTRSTERG
jgi:hypothetical protein